MGKYKLPLEQRFFTDSYANIPATDGFQPDNSLCWNWYKLRDKNGYGKITYQSRNLRAHRIAYEISKGLTIGSLKADQLICHTCDNPSCINPKHLFLGTPKDNTADMIKKGRNSKHIPPPMPGSSNPFYGKTHSAETRAKIAESNRRRAKKLVST
jgi:hypothetical protein